MVRGQATPINDNARGGQAANNITVFRQASYLASSLHRIRSARPSATSPGTSSNADPIPVSGNQTDTWKPPDMSSLHNVDRTGDPFGKSEGPQTFFLQDKFKNLNSNTENGGAERDRTADPLLAKQVLSQLSYSPNASSDTQEEEPRGLVGPGRLELPTSRLSGVRSNHLSYGPDSTLDSRSEPDNPVQSAVNSRGSPQNRGSQEPCLRRKRNVDGEPCDTVQACLPAYKGERVLTEPFLF